MNEPISYLSLANEYERWLEMQGEREEDDYFRSRLFNPDEYEQEDLSE